MKKKTMIITGIIMILIMATIVLAQQITKNQLANYTNEQIKTKLQNNFNFSHYEIDRDDDYIRFYYDFKTIEPDGENYTVKEIKIIGNLPLSHWRTCKESYSNNVCYNQLVNADQIYELNVSGNVGNHSTVYKQVKEKAVRIFTKIKAERDRIIDEEDLTYFNSVTPNSNLPLE